MTYKEKHISNNPKSKKKAFLSEIKSSKSNNEQLIVPNQQWMSSVFSFYNKKAFGNALKTPKFSTKCEKNEWGCYYPGNGIKKGEKSRHLNYLMNGAR